MPDKQTKQQQPKKRRLLYRVLTWIGAAMTLVGLGFVALGLFGVLSLLFLLLGCILSVVGAMLWGAASIADSGDDDPQNPIVINAMGARG